VSVHLAGAESLASGRRV